MRELRSTNGKLRNSRGNLKYSMGNGEAKEFICMTHGHEQQCGDCLREWQLLGGGGQRGKNWDNFNIIINKLY